MEASAPPHAATAGRAPSEGRDGPARSGEAAATEPGRRPPLRPPSASSAPAAARGGEGPDSPMLPSTAIFLILPSSRPRLGGVAMAAERRALPAAGGAGRGTGAPPPAREPANGRNGNNRRARALPAPAFEFGARRA